MTQSTTPPQRRMYAGERYLRADHLMKNGKFIAVKLKISDVIHGLPAKIMGKDANDPTGKGVKLMPGLVFEGKDKVCGLNITNESNLCWETGEGNWPGWIGKEVLLVVRLVKSYNAQKRAFEEIPCIRIWPRQPHPNGRVRDQMGIEVPDSWYDENRSEYLAGQKQLEPPEFTAETRVKWIGVFEKRIESAKTGADVDACRASLTALGNELEKHKMPLTTGEKELLSDKLAAVADKVSKSEGNS